MKTFGTGRKLFSRLLDLQQVRPEAVGQSGGGLLGRSGTAPQCSGQPGWLSGSVGSSQSRSAVPLLLADGPQLLRPTTPSPPLRLADRPLLTAPLPARSPASLALTVQISQALGYHGFGLGALTKQVLGFQPPKCRKVSTRWLSAATAACAAAASAAALGWLGYVLPTVLGYVWQTVRRGAPGHAWQCFAVRLGSHHLPLLADPPPSTHLPTRAPIHPPTTHRSPCLTGRPARCRRGRCSTQPWTPS